MSLIRPEVRAALWRGREMLCGLGLSLLGLWAAWGSFGLLRWIGYGIVLLGLIVAAAGWQRMRLRPRDVALGVIELDEGRLTYWGPLSGGSVERDGLSGLTLDHSSFPAVWVLRHDAGPDLHIPVSAAGQDALFDMLSTLPGLRTGALLAALRAADGQRHRLWSRSASVDTARVSPQV